MLLIGSGILFVLLSTFLNTLCDSYYSLHSSTLFVIRTTLYIPQHSLWFVLLSTFLNTLCDSYFSLHSSTLFVIRTSLNIPQHSFLTIQTGRYYMTPLTRQITWTNVLQNRCYMCIPWTRVLYSVVITRQSNLFRNSVDCNEFRSVWPMLLADCVMNSGLSNQCS